MVAADKSKGWPEDEVTTNDEVPTVKVPVFVNSVPEVPVRVIVEAWGVKVPPVAMLIEPALKE